VLKGTLSTYQFYLPDLFPVKLIKPLKFITFYYKPKQRILHISWMQLSTCSLTPYPDSVVLTDWNLGNQKNVCKAEPPRLQKQFLLRSLPPVTPHESVVNDYFKTKKQEFTTSTW